MEHIHTPERLSGESFADYKARRAASKAAVRAMTRAPMQMPAQDATDVSRFFLGTHTNTARNVEREALRTSKSARIAASQKLNADKPRKHKQHKHPKDASGSAITHVGRNPRRTWLGGISAQRGY